MHGFTTDQSSEVADMSASQSQPSSAVDAALTATAPATAHGATAAGGSGEGKEESPRRYLTRTVQPFMLELLRFLAHERPSASASAASTSTSASASGRGEKSGEKQPSALRVAAVYLGAADTYRAAALALLHGSSGSGASAGAGAGAAGIDGQDASMTDAQPDAPSAASDFSIEELQQGDDIELLIARRFHDRWVEDYPKRMGVAAGLKSGSS